MLKSKQVILTPLIEEDLPVLYDWINQREQVLFNAPYKPVHFSQHRNWFESVTQRNDMVIFGIRLVENNRLVGTCQLHSIHPVHRSAELQIRLGLVEAHGHGYGTEAICLLLDFAFRDINLHRVFLHVFASNAAAIRIYEKAGFKREGLLRDAAYINSEYCDIIVMGILRKEYKTLEDYCHSPT